jgi:hypothetical protein
LDLPGLDPIFPASGDFVNFSPQSSSPTGSWRNRRHDWDPRPNGAAVHQPDRSMGGKSPRATEPDAQLARASYVIR